MWSEVVIMMVVVLGGLLSQVGLDYGVRLGVLQGHMTNLQLSLCLLYISDVISH